MESLGKLRLMALVKTFFASSTEYSMLEKLAIMLLRIVVSAMVKTMGAISCVWGNFGKVFLFMADFALKKHNCAPNKRKIDLHDSQDWYPEHFEYPVGYHPTTPCAQSETSYRTFDRSFYYDHLTHSMIYEPLAMRHPDYVHTHFGAEGLCRTSNVGLDMMEVNTARICTRVLVSKNTADPSVPGRTPADDSYMGEQCAATSRDTPWHKGDDPMTRCVCFLCDGMITTVTIYHLY